MADFELKLTQRLCSQPFYTVTILQSVVLNVKVDARGKVIGFAIVVIVIVATKIAKINLEI